MIKTMKKDFIQYNLLFFTVLSIFISNAYAQSAVGIITNMDGDISIINGDKRTADFGDDIVFKDKIKVGANSSLVITYYAGCRQEWFGENTVLEVGSSKKSHHAITNKLIHSTIIL